VRIKRAARIVNANTPARPAGSVGTVASLLTRDPYGHPLDKTWYIVDFGTSSDSFTADELGRK
jgi:hypothetical protein